MKVPSLFTPRRRPHHRSDAAQPLAQAMRSYRPEHLEDRILMAVGPQLIAIQPNSGNVLSNGVVRNVAPQELTFVFDESQRIDNSTLAGIRITRAGFDNTFDGVTDVLVTPGFAGVDPDRPNEVIVRFAEALPDDLYRIEVFAVDDPSRGRVALRNVEGDAFLPQVAGADRTTVNFELDLGAQVLAVVPQPITRQSDGTLSQARDQIAVYFNNDDLNPTSATNPAFYSLIFSSETVENTDDVVIHPDSVTYDPVQDLAILTFSSDLDSLNTGTGTYRLRIGSDDPLPGVPQVVPVESDPGSSFGTSHQIGSLGSTVLLSGAIEPQDYPLQYPGSVREPGHRDIHEVERHYVGTTDETPGITIQPYNFKTIYGWNPQGTPLLNLITEEQKIRAREIFELYGHYLGVQFVETVDEGFTIVTGDLRAISPGIVPGPGGVIGLAGDANPDPMIDWPTAIMDNAELWDDAYGETQDPGRLSWFETAMHEIGHLLGLGHSYELPPKTIMGEEPEELGLIAGEEPFPEPVYPGEHDIVHGRHLYRPEGNDIDIYDFELTVPGVFSAEIIAERLPEVSQLDAALTLYRQRPNGPELIARNDDYFSEDAFIGLELEAGRYFIAVTSTGNLAFDPTIENTGAGGTTDGPYQLRLDFSPREDNFLVDATGTLLDGDADGKPGGQFNFWFRVEDEAHTVFVDKSAPAGGSGTLASPYNNLGAALAAVQQIDGRRMLRVVGNGGADGDINTLGDNLAYELGINEGRALADGNGLQVPANTTLVIDAGAVFKMLKANVHVGSSSVTIDRSGSAMQVLGTPQQRVVFTSYDDQQTGVDTNPRQTTPDPGDWGGLIVQNDHDRAEGRFDYEQIGAYLNIVNQADIRYGGGNVLINSVQQVINPIHMVDARPTASYNRISFSADAAMSASPDSFEETNFSGIDSLGVNYQQTPFTPDYERVGPDLRGNRLLNNSINGIFIRIETPAGDRLERMTVSGRWDDTDIVHVVAENLLIDGTPGGPIKNASGQLTARTDAQLAIDPGVIVKLDGARIETRIGAQLLAEGLDGYEVIFTSLRDDRYGAGGTFNTSTPTGGERDLPLPGDWGGIYLAPAARGSIDHAVIAYAGGLSRIEGTFARFNAVEIQQAEVRLANSTLEHNANGRGGQSEPTRGGLSRNGEGAIYIRSAQPIIVNNIIKNTSGSYAGVINVNVGALNHEIVTDYGRSTGLIDDFEQFVDNQGPLIRLNRLGDNSINGMVVRGETWIRTGTTLDFQGAVINTESVWDDTDIVHVVFDELIVSNLHTYGGLRLESSSSESLVVKFGGPQAGLKASGAPLDIDDRIGGMLHLVGQPGHPVVLTALNDDTVGAGFDPVGRPQTDTDGFRRAPAEQPAGSFQIDLKFGPLMKERPQYVAAAELAVRFWERWVEDPITVVLDMEIDPALMNSGTLGAASPEQVLIDWDTVRQAMIDDGRAHEADLLGQMPVFDDTNFTVPRDPANPFSIDRELLVTRANALALGFDPDSLPATPSAYDPLAVRDGSIVFAPNPFDITADGWPSFFDLDRLDGITPDFVDFVGVVVHEIGHALGFVSGVDTIDAALNDPASLRDINLQPLDMFRLEPGDGSQEGFGNAARAVDPALAQVFYDGGRFDPYGIDIPGLRLGDIPLSQGTDNGDGGQASHWKDLGRTLGLMDPTVPNSEAWFSEVDRSAFDLIGWDVVGDPVAGDWRGISLETYSHDRNVGVVTELEDPDLPGPGSNALPATAQFLGSLGSHENESDENLRLGFVVHGTIDEPADVDVYSFEARAGTEVWLDIDRTSNRLDSVVELVDANGVVLARSDNSYAEAQGTESRFAAAGVHVDGLQKTLFYDQDYYSTNLYDAGLRVILPGAVGKSTTFHVRVRSSSDTIDVLSAGLTQGAYQLQIRLSEIDEHAGSSIQFADIRYAMDGIRIKGLPRHSPLAGDVREDVWFNSGGQPIDNNDALPLGETTGAPSLYNNSRVLVRPTVGPLEEGVSMPQLYSDSFQDAQYIGNVLQSDRAAISLAGMMDNGFRQGQFGSDVVDWYLFEVRFDSIQQSGGNTAELTFDLDYADGMARPDLGFAIYEANFISTTSLAGLETQPGALLYHSLAGGGPDDHPAPLQGGDLDDMSRGSVGQLDPFIGPVSLTEGYYLLQVVSTAAVQLERLQYSEKLPPNPYSRFEPVDAIYRIAEDRINEPITDDGQGTTYTPPQIPVLLDAARAAVPFTLSDVSLFVSTSNSIRGVDPFTGRQEVNYGALTGVDGAAGVLPIIGDFAFRDNPLFDPTSTDPNTARTQRLMAFAQDLGQGLPPSDATVGAYLFLDLAEETSAERPGSPLPAGGLAVRGVGPNGELTDDLIETYGPDPESEDPAAPEVILVDEGVFYDAITFNPGSTDIGEGYAIGRRTQAGVNNILIRFDAATGQAISATLDVQDEAERLPVPNPIPQPPPAVPLRQPNAGFDIVEQGVLDTTKDDGSDGGDITGIAFLSGRLYGVSDEGGLYNITGFAGQGARAQYITTINVPNDDPNAEPEPITFTGLAAGPQDVEGGLYSDLLFGIDRRGNLYAFNAQGELQPIFVDGALSVSTGVSGATGLDFGGLDENLWHITQQRGGDPGHGRLFPSPQGGGASFYFGEDQNPGGGAPRRYDFLGGAHGSLVSNEFSLEGFDASHDPYVYFTYFLTTEEAFNDPLNPSARDAFRVFIADDSREDLRGQWHLLASNQTSEIGTALDVNPQDDILINVQPLWDNSWQDVPFVGGDPDDPTSPRIGRNGQRDPFPYPDEDDQRPFDPLDREWPSFGDRPLSEREGVWRQARISLKDFANSSSLRLRFDFSTAGSMDVGRTGGIELRALAGTRLEDGDTFVIDDQTFEFDLGYTLMTRSAQAIVEGETVTVVDADNNSVTFEFDQDGQVTAGNVAVPYAPNEPAAVTAATMWAALQSAGPAGVTPYVFQNRINLAGAVDVQTSANGSLILEGSPGAATGVPVLVDYGMTADAVAEAMVQPLADAFANGVTSAIKWHGSAIRIINHDVSDPGPLGVTERLPGDALGNFNTPLRAKNTPAGTLNDDRLYTFEEEDFNFTIPFEGVYVDDLIIGFAAFGERGVDLRPDYDWGPVGNEGDFIPNVFETELGGLRQVTPPPGSILQGEYQLEIRRASDYAAGQTPVRTFDPRTRLSQNVSLIIPSGAELYDGQTIFVSDGVSTFTFEFDEEGAADGVLDGHIAIPFSVTDPAPVLVEALRDAINTLFLNGRLRITAAGSNGAEVGSVGTTNQLDLFGSPVLAGGDLEPLVFNESGSVNRNRDQGQVMIASNTIKYSALFGVVVEDSIRAMPCNQDSLSDSVPPVCDFRHYDLSDFEDHAQGSAADYTPSYGVTRNLRELNQEEQAPGIVIGNNVIAFGGEGAIHYSGDPGGRVIIPPVGGPPGLAEVWDDENVHFLLLIEDLNGHSEVFEFRQQGQAPLDLSDQVIEWVVTPDCPAGQPPGAIHWVPSCGPRWSPQYPDMAEAMLTAIARSNLDVRPYWVKGDELYLEGIGQILSLAIEGTPTSVTFVADEWFYPFNTVPQQSIIPFGRIVNNTLVGLGGTLPTDANYNNRDFFDTGILIEDNAAPTLLNNVIVNFDAGIRVDQTAGETVIGGSLYQGNTDNARGINIGDFAIELPNAAPLFVDWQRGNFYPADLSRVIDSSIDSLEDRRELVAVREAVGIARSPILAPNYDALGQLRIDDPRVESPDGFGNNVFKDRGAIDRVDFLGPIAQFLSPQDNDNTGRDQNPEIDRVRIENATLSSFVIQLVDLGQAIAPTGTGIDDSIVTSNSVILRRDGQVLEPGVDYRFDYQPTTNQILLTPQAGVWLPGFTYEIELINRDRFVISSGDLVGDGQTFTVTDASGTTQTFEFDSGISLHVPETLTLIVPTGSSGLAAVSDGELFTISNGVRVVTFELDSNNSSTPGRVRVPFTPSSTPDQLADALVTAISSAELGLDPLNLGGGRVHVGGSFTTILDTTISSLEQSGQGGVFLDGQTLTVRHNGTNVRFEFDNDGVVAGTHRPIPFNNNDTQRQLAIALRDALNASPLTFDTVLGPMGIVNIGSVTGVAIETETSSVVPVGQPGIATAGAIAVPVLLSEDIDQRAISELMQQAIESSNLTGLTLLVDEAGRLVIIDAEDVSDIENQFIPGIRDIAGNLLRTNQDESPFTTSLEVDLPAPLDFGDAPPVTYQTQLADNGARHVVVPNIRLGASNGAELDALSTDPNDDGVTFLTDFAPGGHSMVSVDASTEGFLDVWIDVDADGRFDQPRDHVLVSVPIARGPNVLGLVLPENAALGDTWSRFRFSTQGNLAPTGRASDGEVEDYQITILDIPAPTATADSYSTDEDQPLVVGPAEGLLANDTSPTGGNPVDELTAAIVDLPQHGTVTISPDGSFTYEPDLDFFGTDTFTYRASSEILSSAVTTVTIEVAPQPDPPVAGDDTVTIPEDSSATIDLVANDDDPDGALVRSSIVLVTEPQHGTVEIDDQGTAIYTPEPDFFGTDSFQYTIDDAEGATSNTATVTINVTPVNDPPVAVDDQLIVRQGTSLSFDLLANDMDVDNDFNRQSIVITQSPKSGTIRFENNGNVVFTPDPNFLGIDTFRYTVRDTAGATSNPAVVTVTVTGANEPPVAADDEASTDVDQAVTIDVLDNDSDPENQLVPGSVSVTEPPSNGTVTVNVDGTIVYTPAPGFSGTDTFRYTVRDDLNVESNPATVTVTVNPIGPPWQNAANPLDVNNDGFVVPLDALLVINDINANGSRPLDPPSGTDQPPPYVDVNGDSFLSPLDALLVINHLNEPAAAAAVAGRWAESDIVGAALHIPPRLPESQDEVDSAAVERLFDRADSDRAESKPRRLSRWDVEETDEWSQERDWLTPETEIDESLLDMLAAEE